MTRLTAQVEDLMDQHITSFDEMMDSRQKKKLVAYYLQTVGIEHALDALAQIKDYGKLPTLIMQVLRDEPHAPLPCIPAEFALSDFIINAVIQWCAPGIEQTFQACLQQRHHYPHKRTRHD